MESSNREQCFEGGERGSIMNNDNIDTSFLEKQQEKLAGEAGTLLEGIFENFDDIDEEEFDKRAAEILEQYDTNQQAIIQAKGGDTVEKIFTVEKVAELLEMKPTTIRKWLRQGLIQGTKFGKEWRILERDFVAFIEEQRQKTIEEQKKEG